MAAENKKVPNYVSMGKTRTYIVISFLLIVIGVFVAFFYFYKSYDYAQKCQTYMKTEALVVDHNYSNNRIVSTVIEYEVNGRKYKSTYNFKSLNIQPYGSTIEILYNPTYPDRITTIDSKVDSLILYAAGGLVFAGFLGALIAFNRKDKYRKDALSKKYVVSAIDENLSDNYQLYQPVDSVYRQLANAANQKAQEAAQAKARAQAQLQAQAQAQALANVATAAEAKPQTKPEVKAEIKEEVKPIEEAKPEVKDEITFAPREEKSIEEEFIPSETVKRIPIEKKPLDYTSNPVDRLLDEYASDDKVEKDEHFYKKKEKTKFEFASYANNTSISDANINEVGSFIPNIDEVEELFLSNNKDDEQ